MKTRIAAAFTLILSLGANYAGAETQFHRLVWDHNPAHEAVISFSPKGVSLNPVVQYGYSTDESQWQSQSPSHSENFVTFLGYIKSYFVRLQGLTPDSDVYYRVCDNDGCGDRFYFKTAPTEPDSSFVVVAGGDTRNGWTTRRKGNALIAKIRPLFVMHGGDFTNLNTSAEMSKFLLDWELSYSHDTINGLDYKRIYPLIPTHGNHEDGNYKTLCKIFGVDFNRDGHCGEDDTYGAFNVSPLLRVYTLNSQFKNSGWSSHAEAMNQWLYEDLANQGTTAEWRIAQYHKPMFPHYTGKSTNTQLFNWWAQAFYDYRMNLVVESDTHINKVTQTIAPNGDDFTTAASGTMYVGEGSWGAPARSANNPKAWTIDLASIQQFKVLQVTPERLTVRTAQFDEDASSLSREARDADTLAIPDNVNWWLANQVGDTINLIQDEQGLSVIENFAVGDGQQLALAATDDTFISSNQADSNLNESNDGLLADGYDGQYGKMFTLVKFDLNNLPSCIDPTTIKLSLNIHNDSPGQFEIFSAGADWQETDATWNSVNGEGIKGNYLATFSPDEEGALEVDLSNQGLMESWRNNGNFGLVIAPAAGCSGIFCNGVDFDSNETGNGPSLTVSYNQNQVCETSGTVEVAPGALTKKSFASNEGEQVVLRFTLSNELSDAELHNIAIAADGELDETTDIGLVKLYHDENNNGLAEAEEEINLKNFTANNGQVNFTFNTPYPLSHGDSEFLVTYQF